MKEEICIHKCADCKRTWVHGWQGVIESIQWCYLRKKAWCPDCLIKLYHEAIKAAA